MKIAYLTFEYPPDTAFGGVGTYCFQASHLMSRLGHQVYVFTATEKETYSYALDNDLKVVRVHSTDPRGFYKLLPDVFREYQEKVGFDIIECSEYLNEALLIKDQYPKIPLVVKLHTPMFLISELNNLKLTWLRKLRYYLGSLRRFRIPDRPWAYSKDADTNYQVCVKADIIHSPSVSLGQIVQEKWNLDSSKIRVVPYPYIVNSRLLDIPVDTHSNHLTYIGRIENRKGVFVLAEALKELLQRNPSITFSFVGKSTVSPFNGRDSIQVLKDELADFGDRIRFENFSYDQIHQAFSQADICIFPSLWENFPNVCLEAMAAGRGIVASRQGGMKDMLEDCRGGQLVDPLDVKEIVRKTQYLIDQPAERISMAERAREKLLRYYNADNIGKMMNEEYGRLLANQSA